MSFLDIYTDNITFEQFRSTYTSYLQTQGILNLVNGDVNPTDSSWLAANQKAMNFITDNSTLRLQELIKVHNQEEQEPTPYYVAKEVMFALESIFDGVKYPCDIYREVDSLRFAAGLNYQRNNYYNNGISFINEHGQNDETAEQFGNRVVRLFDEAKMMGIIYTEDSKKNIFRNSLYGTKYEMYVNLFRDKEYMLPQMIKELKKIEKAESQRMIYEIL